MAVSAVVTTMAFALFLWFFPVTVARKLLPDLRGPEPTMKISSDEWFLMGSRLMGLWVVCRAAPSVVFQIGYLYLSTAHDAERLAGAPTRWSATHLALQLLVGLWLLFGAKGLLGLLRLARSTSA
jgi:hypothetical protein